MNIDYAEVVIEPDYWNRGHFYKGYRKVIKITGPIDHLPVGTKLFAKTEETINV